MIPAQYYEKFYVAFAFILMIILAVQTSSYGYQKLRRNCEINSKTHILSLFLLVSILVVWIGNRPIDGAFGDTKLYSLLYYDISRHYVNIDFSDEWGFSALMSLCAPFLDASGFFIVVAIIYFGSVAFACQKFFKGNALIAFVSFVGSFQTFSYATNGIRNGMACSLVILAIAIYLTSKKDFISILRTVLLFMLAFGFHRSTILPIVCFIASNFIKNEKIVYRFWFLSIIICLVAGGTVGNMLASLGFDDRMNSYLTDTAQYAQSNKSGFRPDFLLFSAMPLWLGYYILFKKRIEDRTYKIILNTYILSNAFWVMIMNISFSNRFAYLSWFLYFLTLAYPCLKINLWSGFQGTNAAKILFANVLFTFFMTFVYY